MNALAGIASRSSSQQDVASNCAEAGANSDVELSDDADAASQGGISAAKQAGLGDLAGKRLLACLSCGGDGSCVAVAAALVVL